MKKKCLLFLAMVLLLCCIPVIAAAENEKVPDGKTVYYWSFDGHYIDLSKNQEDLDYMLDGIFAEGKVGQGADLTGGDYLSARNENSRTFDAFTVAMWITLADVTDIVVNDSIYGVAFAMGSKNPGHFEMFTRRYVNDANERFALCVYNEGPNGGVNWEIDTAADNKLAVETWMHIAFTYDGTKGTIYLNGKEIHSEEAAMQIHPVTADDTNYITVGSLVGGDVGFTLNAVVDELVLADYAFDAAQITMLSDQPAEAAAMLRTLAQSTYPEGEEPRTEPTPTPVPTEAPATPTPETEAPTTAPSGNTPASTQKTGTNVPKTTPGSNAQEDSNTTLIIVIIIAFVLVAGIAVVLIIRKKK